MSKLKAYNGNYPSVPSAHRKSDQSEQSKQNKQFLQFVGDALAGVSIFVMLFVWLWFVG